MKLPFRFVDAFADRPFGGNQAAVIELTEWPADALLQAIAAELALPATAFALRRERDRELRWFSPGGEIRLCGHGTLAAAHVLLGGGETRLRFATRSAGALEVERHEGGGLELALPLIRVERGAWPEAAALLGGAPREVWRSAERYDVFVYDSEREVRALAPDFPALARLGNHQITCTAPGDRSDVVSRVFVPGAGNPEDSATGSAHAVLTPLWAERLGRTSFTAHQASARGGDLTCRLDGDRCWIGGRCATVGEGTLYVSG